VRGGALRVGHVPERHPLALARDEVPVEPRLVVERPRSAVALGGGERAQIGAGRRRHLVGPSRHLLGPIRARPGAGHGHRADEDDRRNERREDPPESLHGSILH